MSDDDQLVDALDASRPFLDACRALGVTPPQALGVVRWLCESPSHVQCIVVQRACAGDAWSPVT